MKIVVTTLTLLVLNMMVLPVNASNFTEQQEAGKCPILLVHGYLSNSFLWVYFRHWLNKADLGPIYTFHIGSKTDLLIQPTIHEIFSLSSLFCQYARRKHRILRV